LRRGRLLANIALSPDREKETTQTLKMMVDLGYVKPEEVPRIPRSPKTPKAIVYSPLAETPVDPDLVLFALKPSAAMLIARGRYPRRSGHRRSCFGQAHLHGPCRSLLHGTITSLGCVGNRI